MPRGGKRAGAGRKKGMASSNRLGAVTFNKTYESYLRRFHVHPLDLMLGILNDEVKDRNKRGKPVAVSLAVKLDAAKAAAPYLHRRRVDETEDVPMHYSMDLTKLSDDELIAFERMLIKAHRPVQMIEAQAEEEKAS